MKYAQITGIDKPVAKLVQGTVMFSSKTRDKNFELLDALFEKGFTTFDTAHNYGRGDAERELGAWIESRDVRDQVVILDKGAHPYEGEPKRVNPADIRKDMQESQERLRTNHVEIYCLHRDNMEYPIGPLVEVLNEAYQKGYIKAFGGSNWTTARVAEANEYAKANNLQGFTVSSPQFSVSEMVKPAWDGCISVSGRQGEAEREWYAANNIPLFTWSSLASGFMTGRFTRDNLDTFTDYFDTVAVNAYAYEDNFRRLDRVKILADEKGATLPQVALAYVISQPVAVHAIISCREIPQIEDNLAALDVSLSPEEIAWIDLKTEEKPS